MERYIRSSELQSKKTGKQNYKQNKQPNIFYNKLFFKFR